MQCITSFKRAERLCDAIHAQHTQHVTALADCKLSVVTFSRHMFCYYVDDSEAYTKMRQHLACLCTVRASRRKVVELQYVIQMCT